MQLPYILVWKLYTQACEIVAGTKRELCKKLQVDICKKLVKKPLLRLHSGQPLWLPHLSTQRQLLCTNMCRNTSLQIGRKILNITGARTVDTTDGR